MVPGDGGVKRALADEDRGTRSRVSRRGARGPRRRSARTIPGPYRVGHEAHFAQVTNQFFEYLKHPEQLPAWENPNMLAKYFVTTKGVELSRQ